jgi:hypothetical protein
MPAHEETVVPWHQDNSYWEPRIWGERVLTVWVALVDADVENGCMQFVRAGHASGKTAPHTIGTTTSTWYTELSEGTVARELLGRPAGAGLRAAGSGAGPADVVTVPARAGSVLIFPGTTPHRSLNSVAKNIRWSADFRLHRQHAARPSATGRPLDWFYGLKDSLLLRPGPGGGGGGSGGGGSAAFEPDWASWATVERTDAQDAAKEGAAGAAQGKKKKKKDAFDPVIIGPWMDLWDLETDARVTAAGAPRPNAHVDRYLATPPAARDVDGYIRAGNW